MPDADGDGMISWNDFDYLPGVRANGIDAGGLTCANLTPNVEVGLVNQLTIGNVSIKSGSNAQPPSSATGKGFGLYINGESYIFQLTGGTLPAAGTEWTLRTLQRLVAAGERPPAPGRHHAERIHSRDA